MKRSLWVVSSVAVLALPLGVVASRSIAGGCTTGLSSLQQAIGWKSPIDLTATQKAHCHLDDKTHTICSTVYRQEVCKCP